MPLLLGERWGRSQCQPLLGTGVMGRGQPSQGGSTPKAFLGEKSRIKGTSSSCPHPQHSLGGAQHVDEPNPDNHEKSHYPGEQLTPVTLKTACSLKHFIDVNQQHLFLCLSERENKAPNSAPHLLQPKNLSHHQHQQNPLWSPARQTGAGNVFALASSLQTGLAAMKGCTLCC